MGNAFGFLYGKCCKPTTTDESLGPHALPVAPVGVTVLAHDLLNFEITSQVPDGLGNYVVSSEKAQANWYRKILKAWKQAKPPPQTPEEAAKLVLETLNKHQKADVEGLLSFYGLPLLEISSEAPVSLPEGILFKFHTLPVDPKAVGDGDGMTVYVNASDPFVSSSVPKEVNLAVVKRAKAREKKNYEKADEFHQKIINSGFSDLSMSSVAEHVCLPVAGLAKVLETTMSDNDEDFIRFTVGDKFRRQNSAGEKLNSKMFSDSNFKSFVAKSSSLKHVAGFLSKHDFVAVARRLLLETTKQTSLVVTYRCLSDEVLNIKNEDVLAWKCRIRLRGIDAPEIQMPYGKESQDELIKIIQGKTLKVLVYEEDQYGRLVADVYCNGVFVQEAMLRKGLVWHYLTYDKRLVLAKWEKEARKKRIGLWASDNPEKPWEWRKNRRNRR